MDKVYIKAEDMSKWCLRHFKVKKDFYSIDEILAVMEDMDDDIENLKDKIEDLERDIEDNYTPRKKYE